MIARDFVWILFLNDMRSSNIERVIPVARSASREALVALVRRELATETWQEPSGLPAEMPTTDPTSSFPMRVNSVTWHKSFKRGSSLEWMNRPHDHELETEDETEHFRRIPRIFDRSDDIDTIPEATP